MAASVPLLHVDEHLLVVDKPAGLLVVGAPGRRGPTLIDLLSTQLGQRAYAVHRLDEDTTGAIVVARTIAARDAMEPLFRAHAVQREYLALVVGRPSPAAGRIESRLREVDGVVKVVTRGGQDAITDYTSLDRRGRLTLVSCRLATGRRNQIRAHMSALGCPIAGDRKYGYRASGEEAFRRPMLHSWRLSFTQPLSGVVVDVVAEAPERDLRP